MEKLNFNCDNCVQKYQLEMCYIVGNSSIIVRITLFHFFSFLLTLLILLTVAYYISAQPIVLDRYVRCMSE